MRPNGSRGPDACPLAARNTPLRVESCCPFRASGLPYSALSFNREVCPLVIRVEACGAQSNVSCGPPQGEASARAVLRTAECKWSRAASGVAFG